MSTVKMEKYIVDEVSLQNHLKQAQFQLKNRFSYQVKYPKDSQDKCVGELTLEMGDADADSPLYIMVRMKGIFNYTVTDKRKVHKDSFYQIFPYARSIITNLCAMSALPPVMFPTPDIQEENIDVNFHQ